jgi:outer membrane protein TolC
MRGNIGNNSWVAALAVCLYCAQGLAGQQVQPAEGSSSIIRILPPISAQLRPLPVDPPATGTLDPTTQFLPLPDEGPANSTDPSNSAEDPQGRVNAVTMPAVPLPGQAQPGHIVNEFFNSSAANALPDQDQPNQAAPAQDAGAGQSPVAATDLPVADPIDQPTDNAGLPGFPGLPQLPFPEPAWSGPSLTPASYPAARDGHSRFSFPNRDPADEVNQPMAVEAHVIDESGIEASPELTSQDPEIGPDASGGINQSAAEQPTQAEPSATPGVSPGYSALAGDVVSGTWWRAAVAQPITGQQSSAGIDVSSLVAQGLRSAPQIQAISLTPLIRETEVCLARADFDPGLFAKSLYEDRVDPVGNTLTTGGLPFLEDNIWSGQAGFRQKFYTGGNLEVAQKLGFQNSNSRFFVPQDQGTATLSINLEQPLMRGRGEAYNRSQIFLADIAVHAAEDEFAAKLQEELTSIVTGYWNLYSSRAQLLQRRKNLELGKSVLEHLEGRAQFDTLPLQLAQARAAVATRETALANAERDVHIAESEIRRRIGDAQWLAATGVELLTAEAPLDDPAGIELQDAVVTALHNRPELRQATQRTKTTALRNQIAANELLPDLRLLLSTYISALEDETGIERAWTGQFSATPGYAAGLQYDFPWRNRAARSRFKQAELEYSKAQFELEQVTVNLIADAQQSWYRLASARTRLHSSLLALDAAVAELERNNLRWDTAPMVEGDWSDGQTQSLILDQLLASQQKLFEAERIVVESELELKLSQINLKRATGTLLGVGDLPAQSTALPALPAETPVESEAPAFEPGLAPSGN